MEKQVIKVEITKEEWKEYKSREDFSWRVPFTTKYIPNIEIIWDGHHGYGETMLSQEDNCVYIEVYTIEVNKDEFENKSISE